MYDIRRHGDRAGRVVVHGEAGLGTALGWRDGGGVSLRDRWRQRPERRDGAAQAFGDRSAREVIEAGEGAQLGVVFGSDSCRSDTEELRSKGVTVKQGPEDVPWGVQTVFEDPYGDSHVIVESAARSLVETSVRGRDGARPRNLPL